MNPLVFAITLAEFHGPTGQRIDINTAEISSLREVKANTHWAAGTKCIVVMSNGKFVAIQETCEVARQEVGRFFRSPGAPCTQVCGEAPDRRGTGK